MPIKQGIRIRNRIYQQRNIPHRIDGPTTTRPNDSRPAFSTMRNIRFTITICAIILLIASIILGYRWLDYYGMSSMISNTILVNLMLASLVGLIAYSLHHWLKAKGAKGRHIAGIIVTVIIVICYGGVNLFAEFILFPLDGITSIRHYTEALHNLWAGDAAVAHFPTTIPSYARNVSFYSFPGYGLGGPETQLSFNTTPNEIAELYKCYSSRHALVTKDPASKGFDLMNLYLTNGKREPYPDDFTFIILDWPPPAKKNNDCIGGVAISKKRCEIVYWAYVENGN